jgi:hypothetical protein
MPKEQAVSGGNQGRRRRSGAWVLVKRFFKFFPVLVLFSAILAGLLVIEQTTEWRSKAKIVFPSPPASPSGVITKLPDRFDDGFDGELDEDYWQATVSEGATLSATGIEVKLEVPAGSEVKTSGLRFIPEIEGDFVAKVTLRNLEAEDKDYGVVGMWFFSQDSHRSAHIQWGKEADFAGIEWGVVEEPPDKYKFEQDERQGVSKVHLVLVRQGGKFSFYYNTGSGWAQTSSYLSLFSGKGELVIYGGSFEPDYPRVKVTVDDFVFGRDVDGLVAELVGDVGGAEVVTGEKKGLEVDGCYLPYTPGFVEARTGPGEGQISLGWSRSARSDYYGLVYGAKPGVYEYGADNVGNVTEFVVSGLVPGRQYFLAVTGKNECGASAFSAEVGAVAGGGAEVSRQKGGEVVEWVPEEVASAAAEATETAAEVEVPVSTEEAELEEIVDEIVKERHRFPFMVAVGGLVGVGMMLLFWSWRKKEAMKAFQKKVLAGKVEGKPSEPQPEGEGGASES